MGEATHRLSPAAKDIRSPLSDGEESIWSSFVTASAAMQDKAVAPDPSNDWVDAAFSVHAHADVILIRSASAILIMCYFQHCVN